MSLLIKIQASYLKHKVSIFAPGVPEKMDTFEQKKYFFTLKIFLLPPFFQDPPAERWRPYVLNMKPVSLLGEKWFAKN